MNNHERLTGEILTHQGLLGPGKITPCSAASDIGAAEETHTWKLASPTSPSAIPQGVRIFLTAATKASRSMGL